jgi:hypothetical protein
LVFLVLFVGDGDEGLRSRQGVWILILGWISFEEEGEDLPALEEGSGEGGKKKLKFPARAETEHAGDGKEKKKATRKILDID